MSGNSSAIAEIQLTLRFALSARNTIPRIRRVLMSQRAWNQAINDR